MKPAFANGKITPRQLKRLQTLYGQYSRHSLDVAPTREDRMAWASKSTGRSIGSFSDITFAEAKTLIDGLQKATGLKAPLKKRERLSRAAAQQAGTAGRKGNQTNITVMPSPADLGRIEGQLTRLGWNQARLEAWLESSSGPLQRRTVIRTVADANRVYWGLKRMADRAEKKEPKAS